MPTVKDRPAGAEERATKPLDQPRVAPPVERTPDTRRPERYMRWMGWLVALAIAALAVGVTAVVITDDSPAADLGGTLEQRLAKDAIEGAQQAALNRPVAPPTVDDAAVRLEQLLRKDAIEEEIATADQAAGADFSSNLDARLLKERIEDSRQP